MTWKTEVKLWLAMVGILAAVAAVLLSAPAIYAIVMTVMDLVS